jgi:PhzF family phenazine biosynthesis protein
MQKIKIFQVDAFTDVLFKGNPAAVCLLNTWLEEDIMQQIAAENNLAETAFIVKNKDLYEIRWFTPVVEVDLCGHATMASAHVLFEHMHYPYNTIRFLSSKNGVLLVSRKKELLTLDFPVDILEPCQAPAGLFEALGLKAAEIYQGREDLLLVYPSQVDIQNIQADFAKLRQVNCRGIIITAAGDDCDFVSRFFGPAVGINEDPVTGSAHTSLAPYWSTRLKRNNLSARQLSSRGGQLWCEVKKDRVLISGQAITYLCGEIIIQS